MGSGGTGGGGAAGSGGSPAGGGWGPTMGSGGNAYGRGGVGGIGTAGTMSSGAGGSAMGGFGNTGAGGSGMAGVSTHSGETPAGFTPAYGDPRGLALGMNANGTYGGVGIRENGQTVLGYIKTVNPTTKQVQYRTVIQRVTPSTKNPGFGYDQFGRLVKMNNPAPAPAPAPSSGYPPGSIDPRAGFPGGPGTPGYVGSGSNFPGGSQTPVGPTGIPGGFGRGQPSLGGTSQGTMPSNRGDFGGALGGVTSGTRGTTSGGSRSYGGPR